MVDVGGGVGQVLELVMKDNPSIKGRFVLQDLGPIIEQERKKNPAFKALAYDFFEPQAVQGKSE